MSIQERDYILKIIQQLGEAIARIAGLRAAGKHDDALVLLKQNTEALLGPMAGTIDQLDSSSAVMLLHSHAKTRAYAMLLAERGEVRAEKGELNRARADYEKAVELLLATVQEDSEVPDDVRRLLDNLVPKVDRERLGPRARMTLEEIGGRFVRA